MSTQHLARRFTLAEIETRRAALVDAIGDVGDNQPGPIDRAALAILDEALEIRREMDKEAPVPDHDPRFPGRVWHEDLHDPRLDPVDEDGDPIDNDCTCPGPPEDQAGCATSDRSHCPEWMGDNDCDEEESPDAS